MVADHAELTAVAGLVIGMRFGAAVDVRVAGERDHTEQQARDDGESDPTEAHRALGLRATSSVSTTRATAGT